ncbi:unnamed protein product [Arabis nemorensis]|uniref:FATC domain-containing protein n=1 Tax=Arabis nemorensis TaxID=586526 RepID=A0A565BV45_9BRAS|nr:unnamed protein product [Arabis nemorensis]
MDKKLAAEHLLQDISHYHGPMIRQETEDYDGMNLEGLQEESEGNKDAARALMGVKQKLDRYEGGEMRSMHGQAQQLIQDAIDANRLAHMFPGWGAWM